MMMIKVRMTVEMMMMMMMMMMVMVMMMMMMMMMMIMMVTVMVVTMMMVMMMMIVKLGTGDSVEPEKISISIQFSQKVFEERETGFSLFINKCSITFKKVNLEQLLNKRSLFLPFLLNTGVFLIPSKLCSKDALRSTDDG